MQGITIPVSDVAIASEPAPALQTHDSIENLLRRKIEAMDLQDDCLICCKDTHALAQAAHDAFYDHYPLILSPDDIWFCIAQGFSQHVNLNAETLRHRFVAHEGKKKLVVERRDFILGRPNPWPEVFTAFSEQIAAQVGQELHDLVVADFSTTLPMHRAATEVLLMETFQTYFEYEFRAGCGIPSITLTGAPDDWRNIRRRATMLTGYGADEWISALLPILDELESTSRGHANQEFWKSFFRYRSSSMGSEMTGWIQVLFPYLKNPERSEGPLIPNPYLREWQTHYHAVLNDEKNGRWPHHEHTQGPYLQQLPASAASAPIKVIDERTGREQMMRFVAGMFGVAQDANSRATRASFGWAVVYEPPLPPKSKMKTISGFD